MPIVRGALDSKGIKTDRKNPIPIIGDQNEHRRLGFTDDLPILMINDKVKSKKRLPSLNEVVAMIEEERLLETQKK